MTSAAYMASIRAARRQENCCLGCRGPLQEHETSRCRACLDKQRAYQARRRENLKQIGRCTKCGSSKPLPGRRSCAECLARDRDYQDVYKQHTRAARMAEGLCVDCKAPSDGHQRCPSCRAKRSAYGRRRRAKLRETGVCIYCSKELAVPGRGGCAQCLAYYNEQAKSHQKKKRATCACCGEALKLVCASGCKTE